MIISEVEFSSLPFDDASRASVWRCWSLYCPFTIVILVFLYREKSLSIHKSSTILIVSWTVFFYIFQSFLHFLVIEYLLYMGLNPVSDSRDCECSGLSLVDWRLIILTCRQKRKCHDTRKHKKEYYDELEIFFHSIFYSRLSMATLDSRSASIFCSRKTWVNVTFPHQFEICSWIDSQIFLSSIFLTL